jgi:hypothetical protein
MRKALKEKFVSGETGWTYDINDQKTEVSERLFQLKLDKHLGDFHTCQILFGVGDS